MRAQQKLVHGDVPEKAAPVTARYQPINGTGSWTTDLCRLTLSAVNDIGARLRDLIDKLGILTLSMIAVDGIINGCSIIC